MALLTGLPSDKFLQKALVLFCGITFASLIFYARNTKIVNSSREDTGINDGRYSQNNATANQFRSFPSQEPEDNLRRTGKKIFIAFGYWEQLTMATKSLLDLTALAAYGGRQVVVPFVRNSFFYGSPTEKRFKTLALYYNVTALNHTLRSRGYGTLISWNDFQDVCQGKLDVLVHFDFTENTQVTRPFWPCKRRVRKAFRHFKVERTICMNVFAVDSVEKFENEVVKRLSCVGFAQWRGSKNRNPSRAQFNLSSVVTHLMQFNEMSFPFSSKLLHVAHDFMAKKLGPLFLSVHIRAEWIIKYKTTLINITAVENCISKLTTRVRRHSNVSTAHIPVFLAADFTDYGSSSRYVKPARKTAKSLMGILSPLKPVLFHPSAYNITDRGAVAIVEMNILLSGKHLFVVGGGTFQRWVVNLFLTKNNINQKSTAKCQNELCNNLCGF